MDLNAKRNAALASRQSDKNKAVEAAYKEVDDIVTSLLVTIDELGEKAEKAKSDGDIPKLNELRDLAQVYVNRPQAASQPAPVATPAPAPVPTPPVTPTPAAAPAAPAPDADEPATPPSGEADESPVSKIKSMLKGDGNRRRVM